jgi:hypothetical protein
VRTFEWRILARWRFAERDFARERFYASVARKAYEVSTAVAAESMRIVGENPFVFAYDSVASKALENFRAELYAEVEAQQARAAAAETTALRSVGVPLDQLQPSSVSLSYGWQSRSYRFNLFPDEQRITVELAVLACVLSAALLLAARVDARGPAPISSRSGEGGDAR